MLPVVEQDRAKELAQRYRPVFIQEVKSVFDYLSPINLGEFLVTDKPTIYFKVTEDNTHYYIFYMTYHYRDWSELPPFIRHFDEHRHDNEGVVVAVHKFTQEVRWVCSRAHGEIVFERSIHNGYNRTLSWFEIEAGGHGIYPIRRHKISRMNNYLTYKDYKLVNMEQPNVKKWLWRTVFPEFISKGVSPPNTWNDYRIEREEGKKTNGLIWDNPAKLYILAKKCQLI